MPNFLPKCSEDVLCRASSKLREVKEIMIHKFCTNGKYLVLDVNSGSLYELDKASFDLLGENGLIGEDSELQKLVDEGKLYSEDDWSAEATTKVNRKGVKALCLMMTEDCNLRCGYCFADGGNCKDLMPFEVAKNAIDYVAANSAGRNNIDIDFFGGEPLLNYECLVKTVKYARNIEEKFNKHFKFTVTTNGVLLDEAKRIWLNDNMDNIVLSLDGRREVNDRMRKTTNGKGSYEIIIDNLIEMVKLRKDKEHYIRGTYTHFNLGFSKDVDYMRKLGFKNISLEPVVASLEKDYSIKQEDLPIIKKEYENLAKEYKNSDYLFFHFLVGGSCGAKRLAGCGAGNEYLAVAPDGKIFACHQFVGDEAFALNEELAEKFDNINVNSKEKCKNCWAKFHCCGGCHANNVHYGGNLSEPYEIGCEIRKMQLEAAFYTLL